MADRREFLTALTASLAGPAAATLGVTPADAAPLVRAEATVFFGHPEGRLNLIRFYATGVSAPAGRLRVYDVNRRLLGTAGMLPFPGGLYGELWLPLDAATTVVSELEYPGSRGVRRMAHRLAPPPRWTVAWLAIVDPADLLSRLRTLPPLNRAIETAIWREARVLANPLPHSARLHLMDHVRFLRMGDAARRLASLAGLATSEVAVATTPESLPSTTVSALTASGVRYVLRTDAGEPLEEWVGPDGARVLAIGFPAGVDAATLGWGTSADEMTPQVERWLGTAPALVTETDRRTRAVSALTLVVTTEVGEALPRMAAAATEWNQRFVFPRIALGGVGELQRLIAHAGARTPTTVRLTGARVPDIPATVLEESLQARAAGPAAAALAPVARQLGGRAGADVLASVAREIDSPVPGQLVVNPSPYRRSDALTLPDGSVTIVTDVPPWGYTFVLQPLPGEGRAQPATPTGSLQGAELTLAIDRGTGAIRSLVRRADGREWARDTGLNEIPGAMLEAFTQERLPGVGSRLVLRRWAPFVGELRTTITVYDALPWVDIENRLPGAGDEGVPCRWGFAVPAPTVTWEIPCGHESAQAPVDRLAHLRWMMLASDEGTVLFRALDAPICSVSEDGAVMHTGPRSRSHIRVQVRTGRVSVADASRFGWSAEPFVTAPVPGADPGRLPRFGSPVVLDQAGAAILGIKEADDGDGIVLALQDLTGELQFLTVGHGLLAFDGARPVDGLERDAGDRATDVPQGVALQVPAWGVRTLRITGVSLRGG